MTRNRPRNLDDDYISSVRKARDRHIADAQCEADQTALDVRNADDTLRRAQLEYEEALESNARAMKVLAAAKRPISDDRLIHPIRRVPPELLGMVFIHTTQLTCRKVDIFLKEDGLVPQQKAPYILASVCQQWREIALRTPRMWREISLNVARVQRATAHLDKFYLQTSFERAGRRGVSLTLIVQRPYDPVNFFRVPELHDAAIRPTLQKMLSSDGVAILHVCPRIDILDVRTACTNLRDLAITEPFDAPMVHRLPKWAPNVRAVTLPLTAFYARPRGAYASVRAVTIQPSFCPPVSNGHDHPLKNVLEFFPNARDVTFSIYGNIAAAPILRHSQLRTLRLHSIGPGALSDEYNFPQLRDVVVQCIPDSAAAVINFISRGCSTVRSLTVNGSLQLNRQVAEALKDAVCLEALICPACAADKPFFAALLVHRGEWTCPRLSSLRVGCMADDGTVETLLTVISRRNAAHARGKPVARLARVTASCGSAVSRRVQAKFYAAIPLSFTWMY